MSIESKRKRRWRRQNPLAADAVDRLTAFDPLTDVRLLRDWWAASGRVASVAPNAQSLPRSAYFTQQLPPAQLEALRAWGADLDKEASACRARELVVDPKTGHVPGPRFVALQPGDVAPHVPPFVASEERSRGKMRNFGLAYGMDLSALEHRLVAPLFLNPPGAS